MLRNRNITVGKYYANRARKIAREILGIKDKIVTCNTHPIVIGNASHSPSECTLRDFIPWADHEATPSAMAGLRYRQMGAALNAPQFSLPEEPHAIAIDSDQRSLLGETVLQHPSA